MSGDINSPQPRTQQWHSEQCPVQHKYLINIYQSVSVFFFIMAVTFFVKLYNPVCSLLNEANHTLLSTRHTLPAYLKEKREGKKIPKTCVHATPTIIPESHVGGSGLKQRADILETTPNDLNVKPGYGTTSCTPPMCCADIKNGSQSLADHLNQPGHHQSHHTILFSVVWK